MQPQDPRGARPRSRLGTVVQTDHHLPKVPLNGGLSHELPAARAVSLLKARVPYRCLRCGYYPRL